MAGHPDPSATARRRTRVTAPGIFFQAIRQHDWDDSLPTTAVFFPGDLPARPPRLTRRVAEHIMAQVEAPANLDKWPNPEGRLITIILIRCGLRATDACTLPFDCLLHDGQDAAYLRYFNNKMRREAAVPIDEELETEIRAQQQRVCSPLAGPAPAPVPRRHPQRRRTKPHDLLQLPRTCSTPGWPPARSTTSTAGQCTSRPHQWRHTFACRLINRDVPQEVIRVLLDHESTQMTAHYARITDQTVRRHWEAGDQGQHQR